MTIRPNDEEADSQESLFSTGKARLAQPQLGARILSAAALFRR
jgi:hypothetical protein